MLTRTLAIFLALALTGCAWKSDLDKANANLAEANSNLTAANKQIEDLKSQVATDEIKISGAQVEIEADKAQNAQLGAQLAVKPKLPVTMIVRRALLSTTFTAVFNTTVKSPLQVLVTVRNPTLGTVKQVELHLNPNMPSYLGIPQGVPIDSGDQIVLSNNDYSESTYTVR